MAIYHRYPVTCSNGHSFDAQLARGINIQRTPELKKKIINGEFHRVTCPKCQKTFTVEKSFSYSDFDTNTFIQVMPRHERHTSSEVSEAFSGEMKKLPETLSAKDRTLRVVYGLAELREKLIAQAHNLDDRLVELLKVHVINEHPFLIQGLLVRISLNAINTNGIEFIISYDHGTKLFSVTLPRWVIDQYVNEETQLQTWVNKAHPTTSPFATTSNLWVNIWRWSPQTTALATLKADAAKIRAGSDVDVNAKAFKNMVTYLPRGTNLPSWAKKDLTVLFNYAKRKNLQELQHSLFQIRFNKILEDDWHLNNDPNDIDTLWKLLQDLPASNVEGNTRINELFLLENEGGGYYQPASSDIYIGSFELQNKERFQDVVRHEVGHGVYEKFRATIDPWLQNHFGWKSFTTSNQDIDTWVGLMGGWGNLSELEKAQVRSYLVSALGNGSSWYAGSVPEIPPGHPWSSPAFGPRLAYENTGDNWYNNFRTWHRYNGKAFFLNYYYKTFYVVDQAALDLVEVMPNPYASMSHFEFFAELYALYFDTDDPMRGNIPQEVAQWMNANLSGAPPAPAAPVKRFDWT